MSASIPISLPLVDGVPATAAQAQTYSVQAGDSLSKIGKKFLLAMRTVT